MAVVWSKFLAKLEALNQSKLFQIIVISVIILSALLVGVRTHDIPKSFEIILKVLDLSITVFFVVELTIRYLATNSFKKFFKSGWNIFDTIIVIGSLVPDGGSSVLLARLLRVFRVLRLVSIIPELRMLVNALLRAIPQMGYIALLMFVIFYIYGAVGSFIFEKINPVLWGDVSIAMLTLFRVATFEDWTDVMYETMEVYPLSWLFYLSFIFLTAFIFLNMMVGTILEVMSHEQKSQRARAHGESPEDAEPASRGQIKALQEEIEELKQLIKSSNQQHAADKGQEP
jgi:voltage-gated sodium channel